MASEEKQRVRNAFDDIDSQYAHDVLPLDRDLVELGLIERTIKLLGSSARSGLHLNVFPKTGSLIMGLRQQFSSLGVIGVDINPHLMISLDRLFSLRRLHHEVLLDASLELQGDIIRQQYRKRLNDLHLASVRMGASSTLVCDDPRQLALTQDLFKVQGARQLDSATVMFPDSSARVAIEKTTDLDTLGDFEITKRVGAFLLSSRCKIFEVLSRMMKPKGVFVYGEECLAPANVDVEDIQNHVAKLYPNNHGYWEAGDASIVTAEKHPKLKTVRMSSFIEPREGAQPKPFHRTLLFQQMIRTDKPFQAV